MPQTKLDTWRSYFGIVTFGSPVKKEVVETWGFARDSYTPSIVRYLAAHERVKCSCIFVRADSIQRGKDCLALLLHITT